MKLNVRVGRWVRFSASMCIALVVVCQGVVAKADDGPGTAVTKEQRLEWFRQAKFGMFIHWGPYAKLAGQWRGQQLPVGTNCEWIMQKLEIPREEYREAAMQFNPQKFDADAWAELAAATGMKYVVLTAKHHDGLRTVARSATLLTDSTTRLPIRQEDGCLEITVPDRPSDPVDTVVAVALEGPPSVDPPVVSQAKDGTITLDYIRAVTRGHTVKRFNRKGEFHISKWTSPEDSIVWQMDVTKPGRFDVAITYAADAPWSGQPYSIQVGQSELEAEVQPTGKPYEYKTFSLGTIRVQQPGRHQLLMRPTRKLAHDLMYFRTLKLAPAAHD